MPEEIITLYLREELETPVACSRTEYYRNDFTRYHAHYPALIDVLLFNQYGDLLLQKRGRTKRIHGGKLHTSIGGHVAWGEQPDFCVIHECLEELGAPALVFSKERYPAAVHALADYTHRTALVCEIETFFRDYREDIIEDRRDIKDRTWLYFGLYDGPIEIPDRSSAGYEWIDLDTLQHEFIAHPEQFTPTLKLFVKDFGEQMKEFIRTYTSYE